MKKIIVIGGNGSGKTTFSKKLSAALDIPLYHIDKIRRTDNWQTIDDDAFNVVLKAITYRDAWVIDGNDFSTLPTRLEQCDTVFYFDFSTIACLRGVIVRTIKYYGQQRSDVGGNNIEKFDKSKIDFFQMILRFNKKNRHRYYDLLNEAPNLKVIVFKNRKDVKRYFVGK